MSSFCRNFAAYFNIPHNQVDVPLLQVLMTACWFLICMPNYIEKRWFMFPYCLHIEIKYFPLVNLEIIEKLWFLLLQTDLKFCFSILVLFGHIARHVFIFLYIVEFQYFSLTFSRRRYIKKSGKTSVLFKIKK